MMKNKMEKIDLALTINTIVLIIITLIQPKSLYACYTTAQYQVWDCNTGFLYVISFLLITILIILIIIKIGTIMKKMKTEILAIIIITIFTIFCLQILIKYSHCLIPQYGFNMIFIPSTYIIVAWITFVILMITKE